MTIKELKEKANTVFLKIDDNIFEVLKNNSNSLTGRSFVSTKEVVDELNTDLKVLILEKSITGVGNSLVHCSFWKGLLG